MLVLSQLDVLAISLVKYHLDGNDLYLRMVSAVILAHEHTVFGVAFCKRKFGRVPLHLLMPELLPVDLNAVITIFSFLLLLLFYFLLLVCLALLKLHFLHLDEVLLRPQPLHSFFVLQVRLLRNLNVLSPLVA